MKTLTAGIVAILGRVLLTSIFLMSVFMQKIPKFQQTVDSMSENGVPLPNIMLAGAIVFLIVGGFQVLLGFRTRMGATLLLIFLILAAYFFHDFWTLSDDAERRNQMNHFMKNMALAGTMLLLIARGSGPCSLDNRRKKKEAKE